MRTIGGLFLATSLVLSGCGGAIPAGTPIKAVETPVVQSQSLKGDVQDVIDRATAQDDVVMGEAGKAKSPADQARLTKQAYHILFSAISQVHDRASKLSLNPFEAKRRAEILKEAEDSLWKLRYLEKEGGAKARTDEERLAHYERLHQDAYTSLQRIQTALKSK